MSHPKKGTKKAGKKIPDDRVVIAHLKGTTALAAWLDDAHEKTHIPKAAILRLALADWGAKMDLPPCPKS